MHIFRSLSMYRATCLSNISINAVPQVWLKRWPAKLSVLKSRHMTVLIASYTLRKIVYLYTSKMFANSGRLGMPVAKEGLLSKGKRMDVSGHNKQQFGSQYFVYVS